MEGSISLSYERGPSYFGLTGLQGQPWFVAVAEDGNGEIVGSAAVALREVYVDGIPTRSMYASDLRLAPGARYGTLVRDLHALCRQSSRFLGVDLWHTSILAGNTAARVLLRDHAGVPLYRAAGIVRVLAVSFLSLMPERGRYQVRIASKEDLSDIVLALNENNALYNFAPVWTLQRLEMRLDACAGRGDYCFYLVRDGGRIAGVLAVWDQSAVQRTRILGYSKRMAALRWAYDLLARAKGASTLPQRGELLNPLFVTHLAIVDDNPDVLRALLLRVREDFRSRGHHYFTFGLAEGRPLLRGLNSFLRAESRTTVYSVAEPGSVWDGYDFAKRPPHYEASHA